MAVTGKLKELEEYRAGLHTDSFWHFPPLLNGTWSSGVLFDCLNLQSYFDLWVINAFRLHLLRPSPAPPMTFHLSQHTVTNDTFGVVQDIIFVWFMTAAPKARAVGQDQSVGHLVPSCT